MSQPTKQEIIVEMAKRIAALDAARKSAEDYANENGLDFSYTPTYGMGGTFYGNSHNDVINGHCEAGWNSSSSSC